MATDRDRYPGSVLHVENCYIHDSAGCGIKSRSSRNEIYYNWIEMPDLEHAYYTLELCGYEEYATQPGIDSDVVGNVLIHRGASGVRFGGDSTGALLGRVRLVNNTFLMSARFSIYTPVIRFFDEMEAACAANNLFYKIGGDPRLRIMRNDADWIEGQLKFQGLNNWVPAGSESIEAGYFPQEWTDTVHGDGNPGLTAVDDFMHLDLSLLGPSDLMAGGTEAVFGLAGYDISAPLDPPACYAPHRRPLSGEPLPRLERSPASGRNIGAH